MPSDRPSRRGNGRANSAALEPYRSKRDFRATPEPEPEPTSKPSAGDDGPAAIDPPAGEQLRFVIHEHSARRLHWDLRLERDGVLASWALPKGLPETPKDNRFAAHTEDHPLEYLDFSGEIPAGEYGAGTMTIWDSGTYECLKWEPRKVEVALHGGRVDGRYALFPIDKAEQPKDWMVHRMDPPADAEREPMPEHVVPMLARAGALPDGDDEREHEWAFEIKWDGFRAIAYSTPGELRLESRNMIEMLGRYPELRALGRALGSHSAILDGEIVAFDEHGRPSFEALQQRAQTASKAAAKRQASVRPVTYVIFDLLWLNGHSLMELSYEERRRRLYELRLNGERWQTPEHVVGEGSLLLQAATEQGLEGVVGKRLRSTYQPGLRSRDWVKIKRSGRQEFVIGGWLPGKGKREGRIGALLLGVFEDGLLRYVGRVGTGFSERELDRLSTLLEPLRRDGSPFTAGERPPREAIFCEPRLVAEIEFVEWTQGGSLRAPRYKGLRDDKGAESVIREEQEQRGAAKSTYVTVGDRELKLSNLDKLMYPRTGFSKRDLIDYYEAIGTVMLGHLEGRALTVVRWPDGVEGKRFFQKHAPSHTPDWVRTARLPSSEGPIDYVVADDLATLVYLANLAAIELHTPLARADAVQRPTALVFDLDPGAPATVVECCQVALSLHDMFENLGMQSFPKTSGSKGLQVYVPLGGADVTFEQTKSFAKAVAELHEQSEPELIVSRMTKARRGGKVLIDWSQNDRNKTTVCVYSLRALERPTASTPLEWDEVRATRDSGDPAELVFEARDVLARVADRGDLFGPVLSLAQTLPSF